MDQMVASFQNSYVEVLTSYETIFGDRGFMEIIKLNEVIRAGPQSNRITVLIRRGETIAPSLYAQKKSCEHSAR